MPELADHVNMNHKAFIEKLPEMLLSHRGKYAVFKDGKLADYWASYEDAIKFGYRQFGLEPFYVGKVQHIRPSSANNVKPVSQHDYDLAA
jgi:hypothetical protein